MSDIRALLLTDVVDSTKLSETLNDAEMAALWAAHDRFARDLLPVWRGREIDKTDGMLLLFDAASDAVAYAAAYHRALATLNPPLKARAGLHVGPVSLRENSQADVARGAKPLEVEGMAKPFAARVMSIANGGQTLVSADARGALGEIALRVESHGHWRLKGLAEPVELFEIGDADAPFVPPPDAVKAYRVIHDGDVWLPARDIRHSLPAERDAFVGRSETLFDLARRLDAGVRLVSVLGIGGTGKTRLVTRFGWTWLGDFPGGVWFCDLSQARGLDGIAQAVAQGFDVLLNKGDPVTQLGNVIGGRGRCLVILDNFEQVASYAEETLGRWLNRASNAQFLVTTREVLGLPGEEVLPVAPLQPSDAVALFLRRAEAANPEFPATAEDQAAITQLVVLLDCLPLAIELAAARVRVMPAKTLLFRMSDRFKLLSSMGKRQDRQATLRAVFDWSWELLSLPEKAALAQLSVFAGGFTLEAVESVLDLSAYEDAPLPMDVLQSLVQKSFVRQVADARFDLLVSVKEYASEHLRTAGRYAESGPGAQRSAEARHGAYFSSLDEKAATASKCIELENFVAACRRAAAREDPDIAANALHRAYLALRSRGPYRVVMELVSVVRATPGLGPRAMWVVEWAAFNALADSGKPQEAYAHLEASLVCARGAGDRELECFSLAGLGIWDMHTGRVRSALSLLETALTIARVAKDRGYLESRVFYHLGNLEYVQGRISEARAHYETALALAQEGGERAMQVAIVGSLGNLYGSQGSLDKARMKMETALTQGREIGNSGLVCRLLGDLGMLNQLQGRLDEAFGQLQAALAVARDLGHVIVECHVLSNLGMVYEKMTRFDEAVNHYEAALVIARESGERRWQGKIHGYLGLLHARQGRLQEARGYLDTGEELLRVVSDQLSLGILLCGRAEMEHLAGDSIAARVALAEAETLAGATGVGPGSELVVAISRVRGLLDPSCTG